MEPLSNQQFSHDAVKYVFQQSDIPIMHSLPPKKAFTVKPAEKLKKTKKDQNKEKEN